jgi:hypothetical protein
MEIMDLVGIGKALMDNGKYILHHAKPGIMGELGFGGVKRTSEVLVEAPNGEDKLPGH